MTEADSILAIVNPAAGGGRCGKRAPNALGELRASGLRIEVKETHAAGDATAIARDAYARGQREMIAVGGDGTVHEVINGLFPPALTDGRVRLGFLPLGTGNSFLRDFSKQGAAHAKQALLSRASHGADVIRIKHAQGDIYSLNIVSLGFIADVCTTANRRFKPFGAAGYVLGVAGELTRLGSRPFPFRVDGGELWNEPASMISFCNSKHTGGTMLMAPAAELLDGNLDITFIGALDRWPFVKAFPMIFAGTHVSHPAVRTAQTSRVDFDFTDPVDVMVDGEVVTLSLQSLEVLPNALDVRA
jgi:diacylglycerol kinase (ATP)